jgi:hypothetical protein
LLAVSAAVFLLLQPGPSAGQSRDEIGKSLNELAAAVDSAAAFSKLYHQYNEALRLTRSQPSSSPGLDEVHLGEEIEFGNPAAPEIAVVFLDYECSYCADSRDFIASLGKPGAPDVRLVVRFPTGSLLKDSANVLLHCIYDRSPSVFPAAFGFLGQNQPKSQDDLRNFARAAGMVSTDYEQCLGGTKAMQRIFHVYQYNIELYDSCVSVGCVMVTDGTGDAVSTIGVPLAIFGSNAANARSFKIARSKSGANWWE